jgi:hypothetical protein
MHLLDNSLATQLREKCHPDTFFVEVTRAKLDDVRGLDPTQPAVAAALESAWQILALTFIMDATGQVTQRPLYVMLVHMQLKGRDVVTISPWLDDVAAGMFAQLVAPSARLRDVLNDELIMADIALCWGVTHGIKRDTPAADRPPGAA